MASDFVQTYLHVLTYEMQLEARRTVTVLDQCFQVVEGLHQVHEVLQLLYAQSPTGKLSV